MEGTRSALVIDDDLIVRNELVRQFVERGWAANGAASYHEANECLRHSDSSPTLAVIDLLLGPRQPDGIAVLELIVTMSPLTIPIILTGGGWSERTSLAALKGACPVLPKPRTAAQLIGATVENGILGSGLNLDVLERRAVVLALIKARGNKSRASEILGRSRRWLHDHLPKSGSR